MKLSDLRYHPIRIVLPLTVLLFLSGALSQVFWSDLEDQTDSVEVKGHDRDTHESSRAGRVA